jgi:hypothetical protein
MMPVFPDMTGQKQQRASVQAARDRFDEINADARAEVVELLDRRTKTADAELARWARDHEDAAALRERWARELAAEAAKATAPVWHEVGATDYWLPRSGLSDLHGRLDDDGRCWAVSVVLSSPVLTDETRAGVWRKLDAETADRKASPEWGALITGHLWEWLGGWIDQPEPDKGPVRAGFEVVSRFEIVTAGLWRVLRPAGPPRYLRAFARDLWRGRWHGEAVEARRGPRYLPALILPVHRDLGRAMELRRVEVNTAQMTLPGLVPVLTAGVEAVRGALVAAEALSPTVAHRLVRWIVRVAAMASSVGRGAEVRLDEQAVARQTAGGVEIEIEGGFDTLRQLLEIKKKGSEIEAVVGVFAAHSIPWAVEHYNGGGPLLTFAHARQRPGLAARLALSVSPLLCPGMASDKAVKPADRVLVPALPPPPLPVGGRGHGNLLALDWLALLRLGELRAELLNDGGARLDWPTLALAAGVSSSSLDRALDLWTDAETGRWVELPGGLWRLADRGDEGRAHELLVEGAAMSAAGSEAGKRSASRRQAARKRHQ